MLRPLLFLCFVSTSPVTAADDPLPAAATEARSRYEKALAALQKNQTEEVEVAAMGYLQRVNELLESAKKDKQRDEAALLEKEIERLGKKDSSKAGRLPAAASAAYGSYSAKLIAIQKETLNKHKAIHAGLIRELADVQRNEAQAGHKEAAAAIQASIKKLEKDRPGAVRGNPAINLAQRTLLQSMKDADARLVQHFDQAINRTRNGKLPGKPKAELLDVLKEEKKRFESSGMVPWSEAMRPDLLTYLQAVRAAQKSFRRSTDAEIDRAIKAKNDTAIRELREEADAAFVVKVIGYWSYQGGNGPRHVHAFYSNGTVIDPNGRMTWSLGKAGRLVVRWPNAQAPGGAWVDSCTLSKDGKRFTGANQNRFPVNGIYHTP
ncbi:MAG TPA: hypothetical protein VN641_10320 [Urbifossiella sp.]|nr:hypothetical protein [Urbifossiella sp.]